MCSHEKQLHNGSVTLILCRERKNIHYSVIITLVIQSQWTVSLSHHIFHSVVCNEIIYLICLVCFSLCHGFHFVVYLFPNRHSLGFSNGSCSFLEALTWEFHLVVNIHSTVPKEYIMTVAIFMFVVTSWNNRKIPFLPVDKPDSSAGSCF